jgi:hypothetical protein
MNTQKIVSRCQAIEEVFKRFIQGIHPYIDHYWEYQTSQVTPLGLQLSQPLVLDAMTHHFKDMERYKSLNGFDDSELANSIKVGAFTAYWLASKQPIYDTHQTDYAPVVNRDFALYVGLSMAEIDPLKVKQMRFGSEETALFLQLQQMLACNRASSDALVPIFQLLKA